MNADTRMKNIMPVIVLIAGLAATTATAIANANGRFTGRAYLAPWLYSVCGVLVHFADFRGRLFSAASAPPLRLSAGAVAVFPTPDTTMMRTRSAACCRTACAVIT